MLLAEYKATTEVDAHTKFISSAVEGATKLTRRSPQDGEGEESAQDGEVEDDDSARRDHDSEHNALEPLPPFDPSCHGQRQVRCRYISGLFFLYWQS